MQYPPIANSCCKLVCMFLFACSNLSDNGLTSLPHQGLASVRVIEASNNPDLRQFPGPAAFPRVRNLRLPYAFHCCAYLDVGTAADPALTSLEENVTFLDDSVDLLSRYGAVSNRTKGTKFTSPARPRDNRYFSASLKCCLFLEIHCNAVELDIYFCQMPLQIVLRSLNGRGCQLMTT